MNSLTAHTLVFIGHWQRRKDAAARRFLRANVLPALKRLRLAAGIGRAALAAAALAAPAAHADEADTSPTWDTVGLHVYTKHNPRKPWFNNQTIGLQLRRSDGLTVGAYCNSFSRNDHREWDKKADRCEVSPYIGWMFETSRDYPIGVGVAPTALFGYKNRTILHLGPLGDHSVVFHPMPSLRVGPARVYMLSPKDWHLAGEWRF